MISAAAGALAEAHGIQLIHRDIKPANIMLCEQGGEVDAAKALDFGLVNYLVGRPADPGRRAYRDAGVHGAGVDPNAEERGSRSDIYALGAVAYFLLTGHHVFDGRRCSRFQSAYAHRAGATFGARGAGVPAGARSARPRVPGEERRSTARERRRASLAAARARRHWHVERR